MREKRGREVEKGRGGIPENQGRENVCVLCVHGVCTIISGTNLIPYFMNMFCTLVRFFVHFLLFNRISRRWHSGLKLKCTCIIMLVDL